MRRIGFWAIVLLGALLLAAPVAAQSGNARILDPDGLLGSGNARVNEAAERLAATGADVIVIAGGPSAGNTDSSARQFLNQLLSSNNLAPSVDELTPNQILFYVASDAQITGILFGSRWRDTLDPIWEDVMAEQMNPAFAEGDIPGGFVAGIEQITNTISPPPPNRTPLYLMLGVLVLAGVGFALYPRFRKRQADAASVAAANRTLEQVRREAGAALADLGQLVQTAEDKAQFDRVSYSAADIQRLSELQSRGVGLFRDAQASFKEAEEQRATNAPTTVVAIQALAGRYRQVQEQVKASIGPLREVEQLRAELDARGTARTGPTTRLEQEPATEAAPQIGDGQDGTRPADR